MQKGFEFPKELQKELHALNEGYLSKDNKEPIMDIYVRAHCSKEFLPYWEKNMKWLEEERKKPYIIN